MNEYLNVGSETNLDPRHIPLALRDPDDQELTTPEIIAAAFKDPAIAGSGRVIGWRKVEAAYEKYLRQEVSERWVRTLAKRDPLLRFVGRCPGTTEARVAAHCQAHVTSREALAHNAASTRWERLEALVVDPRSVGSPVVNGAEKTAGTEGNSAEAAPRKFS